MRSNEDERALQAPEIAATDDDGVNEKKEKNEDALIDFGHVH